MANTVKIMDGYSMDVSIDEYERKVHMSLKNDDSARQFIEVRVTPAVLRQWGRWEPRSNPEYSMVEIVGYGIRLSGDDTAALAEVLELAVEICAADNASKSDELHEQERQHAEYQEARKKLEEEQKARKQDLKEQLQWYLGQKFKLRRRNYRATVFGTINSISDSGYMYTTSERGVPMQIYIPDILFLSIMYDGEKRYTKVYERVEES